MKYFAYGSNCNPHVMQRKGIAYSSRQRATLEDFRLRFNKRALRDRYPAGIGYANIDPSPGIRVEGILYDIAEESVNSLDASERHPDHYRRVRVVVQCESGETVACAAYQAQRDKVASGLRPTRYYLNHLLTLQPFVSSAYFRQLRRTETFAAECTVCQSVEEVEFIRSDSSLEMLCPSCRQVSPLMGEVCG